MPVIVKIINPHDGSLLCVYVYSSMKACTKHSRGLLSYYDLKRRAVKYQTYKRYFKCKQITNSEYAAYRAILNVN